MLYLSGELTSKSIDTGEVYFNKSFRIVGQTGTSISQDTQILAAANLANAMATQALAQAIGEESSSLGKALIKWLEEHG